MSTTTRRITEKELQKLKELQKILEQHNIKLAQSELSELITEFAIEHIYEFFEFLKQKSTSIDKDPIYHWLEKPVSGDIETDSVKDHDVTY